MASRELDRQLIEAAKTGNVFDAQSAIAAGANVNAAVRFGGYTALHIATERGATDLVGMLIRAGARVSATDRWKETPLHWACRAGNLEACRQLIGNQADIHALDKYKKTPLHLAAEFGHAPLIRLLIVEGADVNAMDKKSRTPLYWAAHSGRGDVIAAIQEVLTFQNSKH